jgi:hypothetical protein
VTIIQACVLTAVIYLFGIYSKVKLDMDLIFAVYRNNKNITQVEIVATKQS